MRVVVIGGGVVGLACAWELARRDHDVVVLEAARIGGGVSSGNAGWICPTLASPGVGDLVRGTPELYEQYVREGVELELHRDGLVIAALTEEGLSAYRGHDVTELDARAAAKLEPALRGTIAGALHATVDMHVRPETLTRGLAESLRERGAELREDAAVRSVSRRGREWIVDELAADAVVVAAGLGSAELVQLPTPLLGARGYSIQVDGVGPAHAVYLAEEKLALSSFDGLVRLAGKVELGASSGMTAARFIESAVPYLAHTLTARGDLWTGLRPMTATGVPVIARLARGLVVAVGHGTLGITLAPATAVRVASLL